MSEGWQRIVGERVGEVVALLRQRGAAVYFVLLGWIFFRAASFAHALAFLAGLAGGGASSVMTPALAGLIALGMSFHFMPRFTMQSVALRLRALPAPALSAAVGLAILTIDAMRPEGVAPFIYYQF